VKEKRKNKMVTKILSGKRNNFTAAAGLIGLGAMINYLGGNQPQCPVNFD